MVTSGKQRGTSSPSSLLAAVSVHILLFDSYEDAEGMHISFEVVTKIGRVADMINDGAPIKNHLN